MHHRHETNDARRKRIARPTTRATDLTPNPLGQVTADVEAALAAGAAPCVATTSSAWRTTLPAALNRGANPRPGWTIPPRAYVAALLDPRLAGAEPDALTLAAVAALHWHASTTTAAERRRAAVAFVINAYPERGTALAALGITLDTATND